MKKIVIILSLFLAFTLFLDAQMSGKGPVISFDKEIHNFGTMHRGSVPEGKVEYKIFNTGKEPLLLTMVRACCGTQVREYTRAPIAPGDSGIVKVEFRIVDRVQKISRTVTIQSNAENRQTAVLRILGEVVEPPDNSLKLED